MPSRPGPFADSLELSLWADGVALALSRLRKGIELDEVDKRNLVEARSFLEAAKDGHGYVNSPGGGAKGLSGVDDYLWSLQGVAGANLGERLEDGIDKVYGQWITALRERVKAGDPTLMEKIVEELEKLFMAIRDAALVDSAPAPEHVVFA